VIAHVGGNMDTIDLLLVSVTIIGIVGALLSFLLQFYETLRKKKRGKEETTENRIGRLTTSLREATDLINNIESEITARSSLVEKLQKDIDLYNKTCGTKKARS
jgi:hypothetical protein